MCTGCDKAEWNRPVLDALHEFVDYISLHFYSGTEGRPMEDAYRDIDSFAGTVREVSELLATYPERPTDFNPWYRFSPRKGPIRIAVDEWNVWNVKDDKTYGLVCDYKWTDTLWVAKMLTFLITTPAIGLANLAQLVNVLAPIRADAEGARFQPIAYPLMWYRRLVKGTLVEAETSLPLSICAVHAEDYTVVALVNHYEEEMTVGLEEEFSAAVILTESGSRTLRNAFREITIPRESVAFLVLGKCNLPVNE
jgi:alpha-N-arabinofuranosidase